MAEGRWARIGKKSKGAPVEWPELDGNGNLYARPVAAMIALDDEGHFYVVAEGQAVTLEAVEEMSEFLRQQKSASGKKKKPEIRPFPKGSDEDDGE